MASVLLAPWNLLYVFFAIPMPAIVYAVLFVAYEVWADRRGADRVNHSAHLWGAAYGVIFTLAVEPRLLARFLEELAHPRFG
jgi:membrane associated rhomboid family serine protease